LNNPLPRERNVTVNQDGEYTLSHFIFTTVLFRAYSPEQDRVYKLKMARVEAER
jgi:hypothetical protein